MIINPSRNPSDRLDANTNPTVADQCSFNYRGASTIQLPSLSYSSNLTTMSRGSHRCSRIHTRLRLQRVTSSVMNSRSREISRPSSSPASVASSRAGPSTLATLSHGQGMLSCSPLLRPYRIANLLISLDIAEIEEPCAHGMQFGGMCTICGQDMTQ